MLLKNYSDIEYIFNLDVETFIGIVEKAIESEVNEKEKEVEDKLFFRWVMETTYMDDRPTFQEYKDMLMKKPKKKIKEITEKENIELIKEIERVRKLHQGEVGE